MGEQIINIITSNALEIIAAIISIVVSYYVIPMIKTDLVPFLKEKRLFALIEKLVEGAEKMAESGLIEKKDKKAMVIQCLKDEGIEVTPAVDAFIEAAVKELDLVADVVIETIKKENE